MTTIPPPARSYKPGRRRDDLSELEFPPNNRLDEASTAGVLLHGLTVSDGDPIEQILVGLDVDLDAMAELADGRGALCSLVYRLKRRIASVAELRRRELIERMEATR